MARRSFFLKATNRDRASQTYKFPCKGKELSAPSDKTEVSTTTDATGANILQKVLIKAATSNTFE